MQSLLYIETKARSLIIKKYDNPPSFHDIKIINDIIFNEETHTVAMFKEYLIYEEMNEFLKRFYFKEEIKHKMPNTIISLIPILSFTYFKFNKYAIAKYIVLIIIASGDNEAAITIDIGNKEHTINIFFHFSFGINFIAKDITNK